MGADGKGSLLKIVDLVSEGVLVGVDGGNIAKSEVGQLGQTTNVSVSFKIIK